MNLLSVGSLLTLTAALSWAALDALRKRLSADVAPAALLVLINVGLLPLFTGWLVLEGGQVDDLAAYAGPGAASTALQIVANFLFLAAVRVSPLSLTVPFLSLTPVFTTVE